MYPWRILLRFVVYKGKIIKLIRYSCPPGKPLTRIWSKATRRQKKSRIPSYFLRKNFKRESIPCIRRRPFSHEIYSVSWLLPDHAGLVGLGIRYDHFANLPQLLFWFTQSRLWQPRYSSDAFKGNQWTIRKDEWYTTSCIKSESRGGVIWVHFLVDFWSRSNTILPLTP